MYYRLTETFLLPSSINQTFLSDVQLKEMAKSQFVQVRGYSLERQVGGYKIIRCQNVDSDTAKVEVYVQVR